MHLYISLMFSSGIVNPFATWVHGFHYTSCPASILLTCLFLSSWWRSCRAWPDISLLLSAVLTDFCADEILCSLWLQHLATYLLSSRLFHSLALKHVWSFSFHTLEPILCIGALRACDSRSVEIESWTSIDFNINFIFKNIIWFLANSLQSCTLTTASLPRTW